MRQFTMLAFAVILLMAAGCDRESDFDYEKQGGAAGATWQAMSLSDSKTERLNDDE